MAVAIEPGPAIIGMPIGKPNIVEPARRLFFRQHRRPGSSAAGASRTLCRGDEEEERSAAARKARAKCPDGRGARARRSEKKRMIVATNVDLIAILRA
jgi:hypothetical protein